jgi:acyl carrier protein
LKIETSPKRRAFGRDVGCDSKLPARLKNCKTHVPTKAGQVLNLALRVESSFESRTAHWLLKSNSMRPTDPDDPLLAEILDLAWRDVLGEDEPGGVADDLFDAGLESMGLMQLMMKLEKAHGIVISEGEVTRANFSSVLALASMVRRIKGIR